MSASRVKLLFRGTRHIVVRGAGASVAETRIHILGLDFEFEEGEDAFLLEKGDEGTALLRIPPPTSEWRDLASFCLSGGKDRTM